MSDKGSRGGESGSGGARCVVVTGASRGVGRQAALSLVREHGCTVLAVSRDAAALHTLQEECAGSAGALEIVVLDIAASDAAMRLLQAVGDRRVHALVHNAGAILRTELGSYGMEALELLFRINVLAPLLITQALAPMLGGDPPGHVVHIGSMGGFQDSAKFAGLAAYSSSKAALACLAQCLAEEFREAGIRSNCLALGAVDTEMHAWPSPATRPGGCRSDGGYVASFLWKGISSSTPRCCRWR